MVSIEEQCVHTQQAFQPGGVHMRDASEFWGSPEEICSHQRSNIILDGSWLLDSFSSLTIESLIPEDRVLFCERYEFGASDGQENLQIRSFHLSARNAKLCNVDLGVDPHSDPDLEYPEEMVWGDFSD